MIRKPWPGPYRLHGLGSPEGETVLAEQGLTAVSAGGLGKE